MSEVQRSPTAHCKKDWSCRNPSQEFDQMNHNFRCLSVSPESIYGDCCITISDQCMNMTSSLYQHEIKFQDKTTIHITHWPRRLNWVVSLKQVPAKKWHHVGRRSCLSRNTQTLRANIIKQATPNRERGMRIMSRQSFTADKGTSKQTL